MGLFSRKKKPVPPVLVAEDKLTVGNPSVVEGPSPSGPYSAVFEDDGETGYFYALDHRKQEQPILDALHIFNVDQVSDRHLPSLFQIVWSGDGLKVMLLINDYPHAVFDLEASRGFCRTGFPPPASDFSSEGHDWSDDALKHFQ